MADMHRTSHVHVMENSYVFEGNSGELVCDILSTFCETFPLPLDFTKANLLYLICKCNL